jgi:hypothetical protein
MHSWQELSAKKVEKRKTFFLSSLLPSIFLSRFWPFLCTRTPKTPQFFNKTRPENLKTSEKKGTMVPTSLFVLFSSSSSPLGEHRQFVGVGGRRARNGNVPCSKTQNGSYSRP